MHFTSPRTARMCCAALWRGSTSIWEKRRNRARPQQIEMRAHVRLDLKNKAIDLMLLAVELGWPFAAVGVKALFAGEAGAVKRDATPHKILNFVVCTNE